MFQDFSFPALIAGTAGAGTVATYATIAGAIRGIYIGYSGTATPDVTIKPVNYAGTILAVAALAASGWYYPSVVLNDGTAGARTAYAPFPIVDQVRLTVANAGNGGTVAATMIVET